MSTFLFEQKKKTDIVSGLGCNTVITEIVDLKPETKKRNTNSDVRKVNVIVEEVGKRYGFVFHKLDKKGVPNKAK